MFIIESSDSLVTIGGPGQWRRRLRWCSAFGWLFADIEQGHIAPQSVLHTVRHRGDDSTIPVIWGCLRWHGSL